MVAESVADNFLRANLGAKDARVAGTFKDVAEKVTDLNANDR